MKLWMNHNKGTFILNLVCLAVLQNVSFLRNRYLTRIILCTKSHTMQKITVSALWKVFYSDKWGWEHHCNLNAFIEGKPVLQELDQYLFPHGKANSLTSLSFKHWQLRPTTDTCKFMHKVFKISMHP